MPLSNTKLGFMSEESLSLRPKQDFYRQFLPSALLMTLSFLPSHAQMNYAKNILA